ncbi:dihydrofolate reductase family protein, partial [Kandleria vitulina]
RIVLDTHLRIPLDCKLVKTAKETKTIVACSEDVEENKANMLEEKGVEVLCIKKDRGHLSLKQLINILG